MSCVCQSACIVCVCMCASTNRSTLDSSRPCQPHAPDKPSGCPIWHIPINPPTHPNTRAKTCVYLYIKRQTLELCNQHKRQSIRGSQSLSPDWTLCARSLAACHHHVDQYFLILLLETHFLKITIHHGPNDNKVGNVH